MLKKLLFAAAALVVATAMQAQGTLIWQEDFESTASGLPTGWSQTTAATDGGWKVTTSSALSSQSFTVAARTGKIVGTNDDACNCNKGNEILVTPTLDLSSNPSIYVLFDLFYYHGSYNGLTESLTLMASTDDGANWQNVKSFDGAADWHITGVDVSAYSGSATTKFALVYKDGGGWEYGAAIDNFKIVIPDNTLKATLGSVDFNRYLPKPGQWVGGYHKLWVGEELVISGTVTNPSFPVIESFDATWTRGGDTYTESFSGLSIGLGEAYDFSLDNGPVLVDGGANNVVVTISNINGGSDDDATDNIANYTVVGVTQADVAEDRKVVVEEATGSWCGWCPRGAVMLEYMDQTYPDHTIGIAVHGPSNDPMIVSAYSTGMGAIIGGYPSGLVDRTYNDVDPTEWDKFYIERITAPAPKVKILQDVTYDDSSRVATVTSHLQFKEAVTDEHRIAVVFTEDDVTGSGTNWPQTNYYAGGQYGPMDGYGSLPDHIDPQVYEHVARGLVGGFTGKISSVPGNNPAGSVANYTSTFIIPAGMNVENMHAITLLLNTADGTIENGESTEIPFVSTGAHEVAEEAISVKMQPNLVSDFSTIKVKMAEASDITVRIVNAVGQLVQEQHYGKADAQQAIPFRVGGLANGSYLLSVSAKGQVATTPFVIAQ